MQFQVFDLRPETPAPPVEVEATSPEDAARKVLGVDVFRSGRARDSIARVYWQTAGSKNMVRLYSKPVER
ncbi:hypothetical protein ACFSX5_01050 [Devosia albogilva]|uniref:Uncharacterized protein n=1 Tax=Devosia albogilva TaxID=429726 RepID=A0ABW5QGA3_9HYPH